MDAAQRALARRPGAPLFAQAERAGRHGRGRASPSGRGGSSRFLETRWPRGLPRGIIHADLFTDNVFFIGEEVSGLIDFYFACTDSFAYDVAICLNAWCFESGRLVQPHQGRGRCWPAISPSAASSRAEIEALPMLCRGAALRFMLTRLVDWLNVPPGALVKPKDPLEYDRKLDFHRHVRHAREYGLERMSGRSASTIYTDGACSGNPGPGGWGAILFFKGTRAGDLRRGGARPPTTAWRLMAAIEGARTRSSGPAPSTSSRIRQYVRQGITALDAQLEAARLAHRRQQAGQERGSLARARRGAPPATTSTWHWVKGHADDPTNNRVDELAVAAMRPFKKQGRRASATWRD